MALDRSVSQPAAHSASEATRASLVGRYARELLETAGVSSATPLAPWASDAAEDDPHVAWANSGAMALTGFASGAPLPVPAPVATAADGALLAFRSIAGERFRDGGFRSGAALLAERAAIAGFERAGDVAPGGACRLLAASDGWLAVNLARPSDREMLSAWLEAEVPVDDTVDHGEVTEATWAAVRDHLRTRSVHEMVERAGLMALPVAEVAEHASGANGRLASVEFLEGPLGPAPEGGYSPRVLDLSSLWAGPLCGALLAAAGGDVVKCESIGRPDGARSGPKAFYDRLNGNKRSVGLDFASDAGRRTLRVLVERADIVIESARPRAMSGLGIDAQRWIEARAGRTWVSITGYGREEPLGHRVAFGDDATAASGLCWATARANGIAGPVFCGDALADPLTGLHAAVFALGNHTAGHSRLVALSLRGVVASTLALAMRAPFDVCARADELDRARGLAARAPVAREAVRCAAQLGADHDAVLDDWGVSP